MAQKKSLIPQGQREETFADNPFLSALAKDVEAEEKSEEEQPARVRTRKHRAKPFHEVYTQFTNYIHRDYELPFEELCDSLEVSRTELHNEALYLLFQKYKDDLAACNIDVDRLPPHPRRKKRV